MFNSLLGKAKEKKEQKLLEKREKYYRSEILPEIRKIVQGEFVTSKIGVVDKIDEKKCNLNKDELIELCGGIVVGLTKFNKIIKVFADELEMFLHTNESIQNDYINFVYIQKKDPNEFYYNDDKYLIDVFKKCFENEKTFPFSKSAIDYLKVKSCEQIINEFNRELSDFKKAEEILLKVISMPKATLAYVCAVKQMEASLKTV